MTSPVSNTNKTLSSFWRIERSENRPIELRNLQDRLTFLARHVIGRDTCAVTWDVKKANNDYYGLTFALDSSALEGIALDEAIPDERVDVLFGDVLFRSLLQRHKENRYYAGAIGQIQSACLILESGGKIPPTIRDYDMYTHRYKTTANPLRDLTPEDANVDIDSITSIIQHSMAYAESFSSDATPAVKSYVQSARDFKRIKVQPIIDALSSRVCAGDVTLQDALDFWGIYVTYNCAIPKTINHKVAGAVSNAMSEVYALVKKDFITEEEYLSVIKAIIHHFSIFPKDLTPASGESSDEQPDSWMPPPSQRESDQEQSSSNSKSSQEQNDSQKDNESSRSNKNQSSSSNEGESPSDAPSTDESDKVPDKDSNSSEDESDNDRQPQDNDGSSSTEDDSSETDEDDIDDGDSNEQDDGEDSESDSGSELRSDSGRSSDEQSDGEDSPEANADANSGDEDEDEDDGDSSNSSNRSSNKSQADSDKGESSFSQELLDKISNSNRSILDALDIVETLDDKTLQELDKVIERESEDLTKMLREAKVGGAATMGSIIWEKGGYNRDAEERFMTEAYSQASGLTNILRRFNRMRSRYERGLSEGDLDRRAIHKLFTGQDTIFQRQTVIDKLDMHLTLLADSSASMGDDQWDMMVQTIACFAQALGHKDGIDIIGVSYTNDGSRRYGGEALYLNRIWDKPLENLHSVRQHSGGTPSGTAIGAVREALYKKLNVHRTDKVIIHLTDGAPDSWQYVMEEVAKCKAVDIEVYCLLITRYEGNTEQFQACYGDKFIHLTSFDMLLITLEDLFGKLTEVR